MQIIEKRETYKAEKSIKAGTMDRERNSGKAMEKTYSQRMEQPTVADVAAMCEIMDCFTDV